MYADQIRIKKFGIKKHFAHLKVKKKKSPYS